MKLDIPRDNEIAWLIHQGVPDAAMISSPMIRGANVRFLETQTFEFDSQGVRAFILDEVNDCIAWNPRLRSVATWRGKSYALNEDSITNPASYFGGAVLRVHRTPLEWLKANRDGIVIIQPRLTYACLRHARLSFADAFYAEQVRRWLQPPAPTTEILVEVPIERQAA